MNPPMHSRNLLSTRRLTLAYGKVAIPGIIGVNAGASVAAVTLIVLFPNVPPFPLPLSAFGGALAVTLAIYLLAWNKGSSPMSLILVGVGIAAVLGAVTTLLVTFGEINTLSQASVRLAGSIYERGWEHVGSMLPWLIVFVPLSLILSLQRGAIAAVVGAPYFLYLLIRNH